MSSQMAQQSVLRLAERRGAPRFPIALPVIVHFDGHSSAHMTINVSTSGLLIRPEVETRGRGGIVSLDIGVIASGIQATVVDHRGEKTALQFLDSHEGERIAIALSESAQRIG
ncbi:MAG: PilZ domain-containing protein [Minwuia sp.]|uniref:PilZ domain-containing protein n=1 Tax=Minwuia sp. TaxID=2493630 RepID=UPI003A89D412